MLSILASVQQFPDVANLVSFYLFHKNSDIFIIPTTKSTIAFSYTMQVCLCEARLARKDKRFHFFAATIGV